MKKKERKKKRKKRYKYKFSGISKAMEMSLQNRTWCKLEEALVMCWPCWQTNKVKVARCKTGVLLWWLLSGMA